MKSALAASHSWWTETSPKTVERSTRAGGQMLSALSIAIQEIARRPSASMMLSLILRPSMVAGKRIGPVRMLCSISTSKRCEPAPALR